MLAHAALEQTDQLPVWRDVLDGRIAGDRAIAGVGYRDGVLDLGCDIVRFRFLAFFAASLVLTILAVRAGLALLF